MHLAWWPKGVTTERVVYYAPGSSLDAFPFNGLLKDPRDRLDALASLVADGKLEPQVCCVAPLNDYAAGVAVQRAGKAPGTVVISISDDDNGAGNYGSC